MPPADRARRYRSTALDRALAPARTVATVGPLTALDGDAVRAVLKRAESLCDEPRLTVLPDAAQTWWEHDHDVASAAVSSRGEFATTDLGQLVTQVRNRTDSRRAVEVLTCGDMLVLDYSHGVGDGQFGILGLAVLAAGDPAAAEILARGLPSGAVWTALWRHYRGRPGALLDFWRIRKQHKRGDAAHADDGASTRRIEHWESARCSIAAFAPPEQVQRLRAWTSEHHPGATTASVTVTSWLAALAAEGVPYDDRVMILMNCRRYLDDQYRTVQGNFAVGIPIPMPASQSPVEIAALVRSVIESGWPIAILGMAELKSLVRRPRPPVEPDVIEVPDRLRLAVSDLGRLPMFDGLSWTGVRPPQFSAYLEPDGPDAMALLVAELEGGRTFTASFCSEMVDPETVRRALDRMCSDPVGLLATR